MDSTFKVAPRPVYQIYTVYAFKFSQQFPLAYCLLPGKTKEIYVKCFTILKDSMDDLLLQPNIETVTSDFKLGVIQAMQQVCPSVTSKSCFFHYSQAIWRKVQTLGLQQEYRTN